MKAGKSGHWGSFSICYFSVTTNFSHNRSYYCLDGNCQPTNDEMVHVPYGISIFDFVRELFALDGVTHEICDTPTIFSVFNFRALGALTRFLQCESHAPTDNGKIPEYRFFCLACSYSSMQQRREAPKND